MSISRLFRILATIVLVISLVFIVASEYKHNRKVERMVELTDAASSIAVHLTTDKLARRDTRGRQLEYIVDPDLLNDQDYLFNLAGENYASRVYLSHGDNLENVLGPYGFDRPKGRMANAFACPVVMEFKNRRVPARLRVIVWKI